MPFDVNSKEIDSETRYICSPRNEGQELFNVVVYIHNNVRVVAEVNPQKHGGVLLYDLQNASNDKVQTCVEYKNVITKLGAKCIFLINNSELSTPESWHITWRNFSARITKVPPTDDNEDFDELDVLTTWAKHCFCMMFCVLTISDTPSTPMVSDVTVLEYGKLEGANYQVVANRYERSTINRELCLAKKGYKSTICGFDLKEK